MISLYPKNLLIDQQVIAHRGAGKHAPENTLAAFRLGYQYGFRHFSCDVHLSEDRELFLLHGNDLTETTNGYGLAEKSSWDLLSKLDAGEKFSPLYTGEPIPRFEAIINFIISNYCRLNIAVKAKSDRAYDVGSLVAKRLYRKIIDRLDECVDLIFDENPDRLFERLFNEMLAAPTDYCIKNQFLITSSEKAALAGAFDVQPWIPRGYIIDPNKNAFNGDWDALFTELAPLKCCALIVPAEWITVASVEHAQKEGYLLFAAVTSEIIEIDQLLKLGAASVITDNMDAAACFS